MSWNCDLIPLEDERYFETLNGLWKGEEEPLTEVGVIRNTNFTEAGAIDFSDIAWLPVEEKKFEKRRLQPGDVIIERSGGGPYRPVGRVVYFDRSEGQYSFSNFTSAIRVKDTGAFDQKFVFYRLMDLYQSGQTEDLQRQTTNIRNLDFTAYKERAQFPLLGRAEQQRIAQVLSTVQQAIEQQERLIRSTTELKQALMQKLFTEGLRGEAQKETEIGAVPESWEVVRLGSLAHIGNGSTPRRTTDEYWNRGTIPWLNSSKIHEVFITEADQFVTELAVKECHLPKVPIDSLLIAITGQGKTLGNVAITRIETCINQHLAYVRFTGETVIPEYLLWYLSTRYEFLRAIANGAGSTKGAITCGYLKTLPVPVPPLEEQEEIRAAFNRIEQKLTNARSKVTALNDLFRTLLHELMTGKVRVNSTQQ